jgi:hypothetical protein
VPPGYGAEKVAGVVAGCNLKKALHLIRTVSAQFQMHLKLNTDAVSRAFLHAEIGKLA